MTTEMKTHSREEIESALRLMSGDFYRCGKEQVRYEIGGSDRLYILTRRNEYDQEGTRRRDAILAAYAALLAERDRLKRENDSILAANRSLIDRNRELEAERDELAERLEAALAEVVDAPADPDPEHGESRRPEPVEVTTPLDGLLSAAARVVRNVLSEPKVPIIVTVLSLTTFAASLAAGWIARRK